MSQTHAVVLCRQRCGHRCWSCNPGNPVNKEACFFLFFLLVFFHSHPPTHGIVEVKEARMRNIHRVTAAVDNDKSRQSRCNLRGRQRQSFPDHCMLWSGVCVCVRLHLLERDWWDLIQTVKLYEIKLLPVRSWRKKKKGFMHLVLLDLLQRVSSCLVFTAAGVAQVQRDYS